MRQTHSVRHNGYLVFKGTEMECRALIGSVTLPEGMHWQLHEEQLCDTCDCHLSVLEQAKGRCMRCDTYLALGLGSYIERHR